jgi:transcriptional regulator with XRE-family HTH domain
VYFLVIVIEQLAARCDVDRGKISKIENATANYNITTLIELAKGMEMHPKVFMDVDFELDKE